MFKGGTLLPPFDAYVRSFLYLLYTLIKLYYTKALSDPASSLALDWIRLLRRPRIPCLIVQQQTFILGARPGSFRTRWAWQSMWAYFCWLQKSWVCRLILKTMPSCPGLTPMLHSPISLTAGSVDHSLLYPWKASHGGHLHFKERTFSKSANTFNNLLWCLLFFFFFFLFVVNFVIHWNETARDLHVFPIPIPPPTSLSTHSL